MDRGLVEMSCHLADRRMTIVCFFISLAAKGQHSLPSLTVIVSNTTLMPSVEKQAKRFGSGISARS